MTKLNAMGDRVVLKNKVQEEGGEVIGGIFIPTNIENAKYDYAIVISKGERVPDTIKPNDKVVYDKYAGTNVLVGKEEYKVVRYDDILCTET